MRECRELGVTPHVAQNENPTYHSAIDGRTTVHMGYAPSPRVRRRVEEIFGWIKAVGGGRQLRYLGRERNQMWPELTAAAFNLTQIANLELATAA